MKYFGQCSTVFAAALCWGVIALPAGAASPIPSNADAARQHLSATPEIPLPALEKPVHLQSSAPGLPETLASRKFTLRTVTFDGASAFPEARLQAFFTPYHNQEITVRKLFELVAAVQQLYLDAAYTISRVDLPEQDITTGHIRLRVIEGYVASVRIADKELQSSHLVQDIVREIRTMRPLDTRRLERLMMILAMRPGLESAAVLAPYESMDETAAAGAITLILKRQAESDSTGYVELNNHGSYFLGPWRARAGWRQGRLLGSDMDMGVALGLTPDSGELFQISLDGRLPVFGASGTLLQLAASKTITSPGEGLKDLDVEGKSGNLSLGITYPVILQRDRRWNLDASFEYLDSTTDMLSDRIYDDRLRVLSLGTTYSFHDGAQGINTINTVFRQGFNILGAHEGDASNRSRADGRSGFEKITASISRTQQLGHAFEAMIGVDGQYAWSPLLSSEEFGYGGAHLGRAYDPSELVGDRGVAAQAELRYTTRISDPLPVVLQPYGFYDIGKVWNIDDDNTMSASGSSAGFGIRLGFMSGTSGNLAVAFPLTRQIENPPKYSSKTGPRVLFSLQHNF